MRLQPVAEWAEQRVYALPKRWREELLKHWEQQRASAASTSDWRRQVEEEAAANRTLRSLADSLGGLSPSAGVGTGVRYASPVGPLQADIAYGLKARKLRVHLTVGVTF